jgi:hypothetical protein
VNEEALAHLEAVAPKTNKQRYNIYNSLIIETTYTDMQREASISIETIKKWIVNLILYYEERTEGKIIYKFWSMKKRNGRV